MAEEAFLAQIPTETMPGERRLLLNYFRSTWDGQGNVVEIGPFLGGTTRAIALGMAQNPRLSADAVLHTFDRFGDYYEPDELRRMVEPLVAKHVLTEAEANHLCATGKFLELFEAVHRPHDYARLIRAHDALLPDLPGDVADSTSLDLLAAATALGAVFIDGCKSWASTHYAMTFLLPRTRAGAPVIFQDFGWYTCFWISSFTHALREVLEFHAQADSTYFFHLKRCVTAEEVSRLFPKTPAALPVAFFRQAAESLMRQSREGGDLRGELVSILHHVGALVTLRRRAEAAAILKALDVPRYAEFAMMMRGAVKSPTYWPGGKPILWSEI